MAATEAIDNGRGLWNPANPIPELPYEFRFNQRSGPDKYVGDYFTKKYVEPAQWESIPAQNRVFFFSEQDAKAAGYTLHVVMDVAHLDELVAYGVKSGFITNQGIANSLLAKVKSIQKNEADAKNVLNSLNALKKEIKAQTGKKITAQFAAKLLKDISFVEKTYTTK